MPAMSLAMTDAVTVFYNADCPICAREIAHYRARAERTGAPLRFEGLDSPALGRAGLTPEAAARRMHALENGRLVSGVPAFLAIWRRLPGFGWLARFVALPGVRQIAGALYEYLAAPALYALHRRRVARQGCA